MFPAARLTSGGIEMDVMLPDAEKGFYRGPRFDWSGLVHRVHFKGHTWFGPWQPEHKPAANDHAVGPAEEFGMGIGGMPAPFGYAEAPAGGTFLKLGVGELRKVEEPGYRFGFLYEIVKPGTWTVQADTSAIEFRQDAGDPAGYAYRYTKRIELKPGLPGFSIRHDLCNTGAKPLQAGHYSHNFTVIDDVPVGPEYELEFPFAPVAKRDLRGMAAISGSKLNFLRELVPGEALFTEFGGYQGTVAENGVLIRCRRGGAALKITGDRPVHQYNFFATRTTLCPEPFILLQAAPGESIAWTTEYQVLV